MVARLEAAPQPGWPHRLFLGAWEAGDDPCEAVLHALGVDPPSGLIQLIGGEWPLTHGQLMAVSQHLEQVGLKLECLISCEPTSLVAAAALGLSCQADGAIETQEQSTAERAIHVHRGTVRAGEHLAVDGAVLVLGDVNPGARISARGDVLVWGRLRGIAHAGCDGDQSARIVALQLRPVQLRIAEAVARGPEEPPPEGVTEQAELQDGQIAIRAAQLGVPITCG